MPIYNLCFLGFGNVGRALARLFFNKSTELRDRYGIEWRITGIATRRLGWLTNVDGFDREALLSSNFDQGAIHGRDARATSAVASDFEEWLQRSQPAAVLETTSLNVETGQPAIDYLSAALRAGAHAITANKGTVVHGYEALSSLAREAGKRYLFESTVMDSAPVFSLFRECLPAANLRGFAGVFNSTTNVILEAMETGRTFEEGVQAARELGVTETDPSHDVDGWDSTVKVCALSTVLLKKPLKPGAVSREGIRGLDPKTLQRARADGRPFKLVSRARVEADGTVTATVRPEQLNSTDPLASVRGTSLAAHFELDMMPGLTVMSHRPNLQSTAYGLLADFINAVKGRS
jgi:homoserine dehydrogenase